MTFQSTRTFYTPAPQPHFDTRVNCVFKIHKCYLASTTADPDTPIHMVADFTILFKAKYGQLDALQPLMYDEPRICKCRPVYRYEVERKHTTLPMDVEIVGGCTPMQEIRR